MPQQCRSGPRLSWFPQNRLTVSTCKCNIKLLPQRYMRRRSAVLGQCRSSKMSLLAWRCKRLCESIIFAPFQPRRDSLCLQIQFSKSNLFEINALEDVQRLDTPRLKTMTRVGPTIATWFVEISKRVLHVDRWSGACTQFLADRYRKARAVASFGQSQAGMQQFLRQRTCWGWGRR